MLYAVDRKVGLHPTLCPSHISGGKNSAYHPITAHSAQLRPPQMYGGEDKRFPKTELTNKKLGDAQLLRKRK